MATESERWLAAHAYRDQLLAAGRRAGLSRHEAEDVASEAIMRAAAKEDLDLTRVSRWLKVVAANLGTDVARRRPRAAFLVATADPVSTGLGTCSVAGVEAIGSPNNLPGAASTAVGTVLIPTGSRPSGCVEGHASYMDSTLGPLYKSTNTRCEPLTLITV